MDVEITGYIDDGIYNPYKVPAFDYLKSLSFLPVSLQRGKGKQVYGRPSNAEIKRWLQEKAITINGRTPNPNDLIEYPITSLVFFPKGERRTTLLRE